MRLDRALRVLGLAWLGPLVFAGGLPAQTPAEVRQFESWAWGATVHGMVTIADGVVRFNADDDAYSFEIQIEDISQVTAHLKIGWVTIKLRNGGDYQLFGYGDSDLPGKKRRRKSELKPIVESLTAAMNARPAAPPPPSQTPPQTAQTQPLPRLNLAPIPPPPAPVDTLAAPVSIVVVGQISDQVKAALGQPDRIAFPPSFTGINKMIWSYEGLTVTFVDGKVSAVEQENRPPGLSTIR